ncbi:hypothetical protein [Cerasicoccus maritimus]|nr:hypothetical protein [Cerasicoccus maritimus]
MRSLACKWMRIIFQCWKTRTSYCDENYLATLQIRTPQLHLLTVNAIL